MLDIEDYECDRAEKRLLMNLREAEEAVKDGEGWLNLDELKALMGEEYAEIYRVVNRYRDITRIFE